MRSPWLIISGDFAGAGGMHRPNYEFARHLADQGYETHLVAYRVAEELARHPKVIFHRVPKLADSYFLSQPLISAIGRHWARVIGGRGGRVIVNGGVSSSRDLNWVHYVHAAFEPRSSGGLLSAAELTLRHRVYLAAERRVLPRSRVVIANSERTRLDIIERLGIPVDRVRTVYLGIDSALFRSPGVEERAAARSRLDLSAGRPTVAFIGALGDNRKGFDTLFAAWVKLCGDPQWDADLAVVGGRRELGMWKTRAGDANLGSRIKFFGGGDERFVLDVLWASDALVLPARYEAYGRVVQEALCCGVPALVSYGAGVAEQYPAELSELLIPDPDDAEDLAARLRRWRAGIHAWRERVRPLGTALRNHTWRRMAEQMMAVIEGSYRIPGETSNQAHAAELDCS